MVIGLIGLRELAPSLDPAVEALDREINLHVVSENEYCARVSRGEHFVKPAHGAMKLSVVGDADDLAAMATVTANEGARSLL